MTVLPKPLEVQLERKPELTMRKANIVTAF